jgi:hypothetical protein
MYNQTSCTTNQRRGWKQEPRLYSGTLGTCGFSRHTASRGPYPRAAAYSQAARPHEKPVSNDGVKTGSGCACGAESALRTGADTARTSVLNTYSSSGRTVSSEKSRNRYLSVSLCPARQHPPAQHKSAPRTIMNVSILSSSSTGSASTLRTLAYPPVATRQCVSIALKIAQPCAR